MRATGFDRFSTLATMLGGIGFTLFASRPRTSATETELDPDQQRDVDANVTVPANATFGIVWPLIYTGAAGLAIHQCLPSQAENPRYAAARPWLRASFALNAVFASFFARSDRASKIAASLTTIAILPTALAIHDRLEVGRSTVNGPERVLQKTAGVYAGWLTVASVVSVGSLLQQLEAPVQPGPAWAAVALPATAVVAVSASRSLGDPFYLAPVVAAFTGIAIKRRTTNRAIAWLSAGLAVAVGATFVRGVLRPSK